MSVIALTDDAGAILERYAYNAYGDPVVLNGSGTVISSSAEGNRYTYTGREWDADLALYHFRARMYDPEVGRFLGRDPAGYFDATMLYGYAGNSPEVYYDPFGLERVRSQKDIACELWPDVCAEIDGCVMVGRVPRDNYTPTDNGCTWVPDGFPWIGFPWAGQFVTACNNHDYCWQNCERTFSECNRRFYNDMRAECRALRDSYPWWHPNRAFAYRICLAAAESYWRAVSLNRWYWRRIQREACRPAQRCACGEYMLGTPSDFEFMPEDEFERDYYWLK